MLVVWRDDVYPKSAKGAQTWGTRASRVVGSIWAGAKKKKSERRESFSGRQRANPTQAKTGLVWGTQPVVPRIWAEAKKPRQAKERLPPRDAQKQRARGPRLVWGTPSLPSLSSLTSARDAEEVTGRKRRGELAELKFAVRAMEMGLRVAKPYGDSEGYDAVVTADPGAS